MSITVVGTPVPQAPVSTSVDLAFEGPIVAGDILIAVFRHSSGTISGPAGWATKIANSDDLSVLWLRAAGTETSPITFTCGSSILNAIGINHDGVIGTGDPFDFTPVTGAATASLSSASLSATTVTDNDFLGFVDIKTASRTNSSPPSGMSLLTAATEITHLWGKIQAVAGATGSLQATTSGGGATRRDVLYGLKPLVNTVKGKTVISGTKKQVAARGVNVGGVFKTVAQRSTVISGTKKANV